MRELVRKTDAYVRVATVAVPSQSRQPDQPVSAKILLGCAGMWIGRLLDLAYFVHSGNPGGSPEATRRAFNKRFLLDLAEDWQQHGREVFKRVRRESPAWYLKVCEMRVPKEMQIEQKGGIKEMSDEAIEQAIEAIQTMLAARAGEVIEGTAEPAALPAPNGPSPEAALEPAP